MELQNQNPIGRWTCIAILLGSALGLFVGLTGYNAAGGIFAQALGAEFGWGRSVAMLSYSASMLGLTVGSPLVGVLMDRFGIRRVIATLGVLYGLAVMGMSHQNGNTALLVGLSALVGVAGASVSVVGYLAVLPQWFDRRLGLALAVAMGGAGLGTMVMPLLVQHLVTIYGWRTAYMAIGAGSIPLTLLACALLRERKGQFGNGKATAAMPDAGVSLSEAARSYKFWTIWLIFLIGSSCTLAMVPHLPAILADRGFSGADAARGASTLGVGLLVGRLVTGVLLDRIHAPIVTLAFFLAGACGILLLYATRDFNALLLAACVIGLTIGAEGDLISYLIRSYFGLHSFGSLYGIAFSGYGLGAVIGPVAIGAYFDRYKNYDLPLIAQICMLLAAAALTLTLGRYRQAGAGQSGLGAAFNRA